MHPSYVLADRASAPDQIGWQTDRKARPQVFRVRKVLHGPTPDLKNGWEGWGEGGGGWEGSYKLDATVLVPGEGPSYFPLFILNRAKIVVNQLVRVQ